MACERRQRTGSCGHFQCPHAAESGWECVDVAWTRDRGFCEVGLYCVEACALTYYGDDEPAAEAAWASQVEGGTS